MKRTRIVVVVAVLAAFSAIDAGATSTRDLVVGGSRFEYEPAATETHIAWTQLEAGKDVAYVRAFAGGAKVQVPKPIGWDTVTGGISGTTLVYQQFSQSLGRSDIYMFDVVTHDRDKIPAPVSTDAWEYWPTFSGEVVVFSRGTPTTKRLFLYDMSKDRTKLLASVEGDAWHLKAGQVNGDFVVWEKFAFNSKGNPTSCNVFRYRISTGKTVRIPNPDERCQYSPGVSNEGTVFFAKSGFRCGLNSVLRRLPVGGTPKTIFDFPSGKDTYSLFAADRADGKVELYFEKVVCGTNDSDIWSMTVP